MFADARKILRVSYETSFSKEQMMRCEVSTTVGGHRVLINKNFFVQPPSFTDISFGVRQD